MIQHFSFKPLYANSQLPGWSLTFYYRQIRYNAEYKKDGGIAFLGTKPPADQLPTIEKMIHELMLFHVYD